MLTFYAVRDTKVPVFCGRLMHKLLEQNPERRLGVLCASEVHQEWDRVLWTFHPDIFLPHGCEGEKHASVQPILLASQLANFVNNPDLIFFEEISFISDWRQFEQYIWVTKEASFMETLKSLPAHISVRGFQENGAKWDEISLEKRV